ncbi:MAG: TonB family protein [Desulfopila sp.]
MSVLIDNDSDQRVPARHSVERHRHVTSTVLSFLFHIILALVVIINALGHRDNRSQRPDVVYLDLTLSVTTGAELPATPASTHLQSSATTQPAPDPPAAEAVQVIEKIPALINVPDPKISSRKTVVKKNNRETGGVVRKADHSRRPASAPVVSPTNIPTAQQASATVGHESTNQQQRTTGKSAGGKKADEANQTANSYLQENFDHIRQLIMDNLTFPAAARKMGLKGKVMVKFTIEEDGRVTDLAILSSSGHKALDASVLATIRRTAPYPRPSRRAQLILPIAFTLK